MNVHRLAYVVNVRLPTEKAHGLQIAKMCEAFASLGIDVAVYSPRRRQRDPRVQEQSLSRFYGLREPVQHLLLPNVDVVRLESIVPGRPFQGLFLAHALVWAFSAAVRMRRARADLHFTRDLACAYWLGRLGLPTLLELHAIPRGPQRGLLRSLARQPGIRALVTLTEFTRAELAPLGLASVPTAVLADGADVARFAAAPARGVCRERLQLPVDRPLLGYVGGFKTIGQEKGIATLIGAFAQVRRHDALRNAGLVCVGGSEQDHAEYHRLAGARGLPPDALVLRTRVPHTDVPTWLRACDVLTVPFPNHRHFAYYASPLKVFEYMAVSGAIVASDLPALREVLVDERNALLVPPGDEAALGAAIARFLLEPALRQRCAAQAGRDVLAYDWRARAARILDLVGSRRDQVPTAVRLTMEHR